MSKLTETELIEIGVIPPDEFHDAIERIREVAGYDLVPPDDFDQKLDEASKDLVVPNSVLRAAAAAIRVGHLVIQGPPGTGKSSLARALAKAFDVSIFSVTAHEDWTNYDVIGRLELQITEDKKEEIVPVNGALTEAVIHCGNNIVRHFDEPKHPQGEWLFIDELNRAHLDKAFGELFSVLGTDELVPINLPHQKPGNRELVIPRRFRIIATLNSYDKQFVQSLSQAIRRRFTFISLDIPPRRPVGVEWGFNLESEYPAIREFSCVIIKAAKRVARRESTMNPEKEDELAQELTKILCVNYLKSVALLFDIVESIRYAAEEDFVYLPIGTAQMIDTLELFLTRLLQDGKEEHEIYLDWAASVKLVPLFESDVLSPDQLVDFANNLRSPFDKLTKRELMVIAAAGMHYVAE
jgi:hypothetical protein